ncbi:MAG: nitrate reductase subunit alpha [Chthonomonadales bacterium]|nr:nitrate reductase subunit alpha [Chthonomonadales bacterium]
MGWIKDIVSPRTRAWEQFYRNRWQHDKVIRSTHGVNCTGGCSWNVYVKNGIVTWEMQALDYPILEDGIPPYEPRGCQRGISYSWYLYSPIRVKYPYMRGALMDLWREAKGRHADPVEAWEALMSDPEKRSRYQRARGKGGFRRVSWDEALELIAASNVSTIKRHGSDRIIGFSPIPAMSFLSYAAGSRYLQLLGGVNLSFYDWYSDLPPASPEVFGEQTDVAESADWYHSKFIAVMGSNPNMTRTPDCHFLAESRHNGTKVVVLAPDFSQVSKYADQWIPLHAGQDGAYWMAVNHVILTEYHVQKQTPYFTGYLKKYTDAPLLVKLEKTSRGYRPGQFLRAGEIERYAGEANKEWKFLVLDAGSNEPRMVGGATGHRWDQKQGHWNLLLRDPTDGAELDPVLTQIDGKEQAICEFDDFASDEVILRGVPIRWIETPSGKVPVATTFDLLLAQYGVDRGLDGAYPKDYNDENTPYTPAWQEKLTGVGRDTVIKFAREWASTAETTEGKCCVIIGAGVNHWYHNNLMYRSAMSALMLCGCVGRNGGGLNHYVGQEKLAPVAPWSAIAFARDWIASPRLQNGPSWHYVNTDQWRYDSRHTDYCNVPVHDDDSVPAKRTAEQASGHTADAQVRAVRAGWLPYYPQFNEKNTDIIREARTAGGPDADVAKRVVERLKDRSLAHAVEDPDAPENWPRVWFIWRGNALMASAKGHEFFLKHYLGTHHNDIAGEVASGLVEEMRWHDNAPTGKLDLVVDLNFRMDTSALYSDIVLPAATWYEKDDLNSTDMHSFIHPLSEAVPPSWESRSDWDIFKALAQKVSELARLHLPDPVDDLVMAPLAHDSPDEMAQPRVTDWYRGDGEPIPGKTMAHVRMVTRHYPNLYNQFISLGPLVRKNGLKAHAGSYAIEDVYDEMVDADAVPKETWDGVTYPSLARARDTANVILTLSPETNGELAHRGFQNLEKVTGLPLVDLAEKSRAIRMSFADLQAQPRRLLTSPCWSGIIEDGRTYSAFTLNVDRGVPWRTLTGRQQFYLDHEGYLAFGEHLPTYKPSPRPEAFGDVTETLKAGKARILNYLTPHGKWHIHSTYSENHRMMTLSRGCEPIWLNDSDADDLGIVDNDWVEITNDNGVMVTRAAVSARIPTGVCIVYHSPERTVGVPKSPSRGNRRAGGHNSLTRVRLKPVLMVGGYGQFTYHFNYWGPTGVNRDTFVVVRKLDEVQW